MVTENVVEEKKEITEEEVLDQKHKEDWDTRDSIVGYPKRFCGALAELGSKALNTWLKKNAPPEIRILASAVEFLQRAEYVETAGPNLIEGHPDDSSVCHSVKEAVWAINKLGGEFPGAWLIY